MGFPLKCFLHPIVCVTDVLANKWRKSFHRLEYGVSTVTVEFEDGSSSSGCLVVGCDGVQSKTRRALFPSSYGAWSIPIRVLGLRVNCLPDKAESIRALDPFFLQGTASGNDSFMYISSKMNYQALTAYSEGEESC